jgi:hypothetical protein
MRSALLARLKRLEQVRLADSRPPEFQIGYLEKLPPDYTGDRHIVTISRDPDGKYRWEERPGPAPANEDDDDKPPPFRVILVSARDSQPVPGT